jgi:hypothetical protein
VQSTDKKDISYKKRYPLKTVSNIKHLSSGIPSFKIPVIRSAKTAGELYELDP